MAFVDAIATQGARVTPCLELGLDGGTEAYGVDDVETSSLFYGKRLEGITAVRRTLGQGISGEAGFTAVLDNMDRALNAWDRDGLRNRTATLKLAAGKFMGTFLTGEITNFKVQHGKTAIAVKDRASLNFGPRNTWHKDIIVSPTDWPNMDPASVGLPGQVVLGVHDSVAAGNRGAVKCIKLGPRLFSPAWHALPVVMRVYESGTRLTRGFTVNLAFSFSKGLNGYICLIEFDAPPSGEITVDCRGMTNDLTPSGALVTNMVDQAELLRAQVFGLAADAVDNDKIVVARAFCSKNRISGKLVIDAVQPPYQILSRLLGSGGLLIGSTREGKLAIVAPDPDLLNAETGTAIGPEDILPGSFTHEADEQGTCNQLRVQYLYSQAGGGYRAELSGEDADSQSDLGAVYQGEAQLEAAPDLLTAWAYKEHRLAREAKAYRTAWATSLQHALVDIGDVVAISDPFGPGAAGQGWSGVKHLVDGVTFDPGQMRLSFTAWDLRPLLEKAA